MHRLLALLCVAISASPIWGAPPTPPKKDVPDCVVVIHGEKTQLIAFEDGMKIASAIAALGGLGSLGHPRIFLIRNGAVLAKTTVSRMAGDEAAWNSLLAPWDVVYSDAQPLTNF